MDEVPYVQYAVAVCIGVRGRVGGAGSEAFASCGLHALAGNSGYYSRGEPDCAMGICLCALAYAPAGNVAWSGPLREAGAAAGNDAALANVRAAIACEAW